jgi:hypothetical protein
LLSYGYNGYANTPHYYVYTYIDRLVYIVQINVVVYGWAGLIVYTRKNGSLSNHGFKFAKWGGGAEGCSGVLNQIFCYQIMNV